ncbi:MAG: molybdenum cofactor guanylyltransferase [Candidatus Bathyarchaeia archaeon]|nr:molybdenum cofactor guanylyltransferase [Candidatus Bathyarchaeota archaeon]
MKNIIILAGGKSSRFGKDKALVKLNNKPLISYVVDVALKIAKRIIVVIKNDNDGELYKSLLPESIIVARDELNIQSPLIGMLTGMKILKSGYTAVLPCDCPFINEKLINHLFKSVKGFNAAIPKWPNGYIEPLHAVYRIEQMISSIEDALKNKTLSVSSAIKYLKKIVYIPVSELKKHDQKLLSFFNINTVEDLKIAETQII